MRRVAKDDISLVMYGLLGRGAFRFFAVLIAASALGPSDYGLFTVAMGVFSICSWISELGLDITSVRYGARYFLSNEDKKGESVFKAVFLLKIAASTTVFAVFYFLAPCIADYYHDERLTLPMRIAVLGIFGRSLVDFVTSYFRSVKNFKRNSMLFALSTFFILFCVLLQDFFCGIDIEGALLAFSLGPMLAFCVSFFWLPGRILAAESGGMKMVFDLMGFSRWIYLTNIFASGRLWLPVFFLKKTAEDAATGYYGLGVQFANVLALLSESILTTLLPEASAKITKEGRREFLAASYKKVIPIVVPLFLVVFISKFAVGRWNKEYLPMASIFNLIYSGFLFTILAHPIRTVIYSGGKPQIETVIELAMLSLMVALCFLLIPHHGAIGAAWAMLIQRVVSFLFFAFYGCYNYHGAREGWKE